MGAEAYEALLRQKLARGEDVLAKPELAKSTLFANFAEEWMRTAVATANKPSEIRAKRIILGRHLLPFFGKLPLLQLSPQLIEEYKALKLQQGLSAKSVNNQLTVLLRCLHVATDWGRLDKTPKVAHLKTVSQRLDFLSPAESAAIVRCCDEPMYKTMLLLALRTGMRLGELFGLEWPDIDFNRKSLTVRRSIVRGIVGTPKSGKDRHIPLTDEVCKAIYECRQGSGLVFHRINGEPLTHQIAAKAIKRACRAASIKPIGWHALRHSFASQLVSEGVPLNSVQVLLGHSSILMTMKYAHLAPSALRSAVEVLEKAEKRETATECQPSVNLETILARMTA